MNYSHYSQADVDLGDQFEADILPRLEEHYGPLRRNSEQNRNSTFDFSNDKVFVEVKRRRNTKYKYPTTMVGENKVSEGLQLQALGYKVVFVFGFTDVTCIWHLNRDEYEVHHGGRWDRGTPEIKSYCYVPIKYLNDITNATQDLTPLCLEEASGRVSQEASQ